MNGEIPPGDSSAGFFLSKTGDDITYAWSVIWPTCGPIAPDVWDGLDVWHGLNRY